LADILIHDVILVWHLDENDKEHAKETDGGARDAPIKEAIRSGGTHAKIKVWGQVE